MFRRTLAAVPVLMIAATFCFAAGFDGRWEGSVKTPDGQDVALAFVFKVDGETVTGTSESAVGQLPISEGKITGDVLSFTVDLNGTKITHEAKIAGEVLNVKAHGPWGELDYDMKRPVESK